MNKKILSILLALAMAVIAVVAAACTTEETELNTVTASGDETLSGEDAEAGEAH